LEIEELFIFIKNKVPNVANLEIVKNGAGYHYTMHKDCIERDGKFLGRLIDEDLDRTQQAVVSTKATDENGIVYAYPELSHTVDEGKYGNCHIYEINYSSAIAGHHQQEVEFARTVGIEVPKTLFIPALNITEFKLLGRASELKNQS